MLRALKAGDRVALQLPNCLEFSIAAYAVLRAGLVLVNTNPLYTSREMHYQFSDSGAKAIVILDVALDRLATIVGDTDIEQVIAVHSNADVNSEISGLVSFEKIQSDLSDEVNFEPAQINPQDIALIQYTGGTTGVSKGACLSHANILANVEQMKERFENVITAGEEIFVCPLPLYHIYAFTVNLVLGAGLGFNISLISNPQDPHEFISSMGQQKFTMFAGLNTLFVGLSAFKPFTELDFSHLKLTISGGTTLTQAAADTWHKTTGSTISEGYGLSETSPVVAFNSPGNEELGTVGLPLIDTKIRIAGNNDQALPQGEEGEILIKGPQVMSGYWQRPEETAKVMTADGYFKTGDVGRIEPSGALKIVDRLKDMIIVSGFNVYPNEVEHVLTQHASVAEAAVIGKPSDKTGRGGLCLYHFVITCRY